MRNIRKRERRKIKINIMKKVCDNIKLFYYIVLTNIQIYGIIYVY